MSKLLFYFFTVTAMIFTAVSQAAAQPQTLGTDIYGYLSYYPDESGKFDRIGWYTIKSDGAISPCWLTPEDELGIGFIADGKLYTYNEISMGGESLGLTFKLLDINTGSAEKTIQIDNKLGFYGFDSMCYVPDEDAAFGYARTDSYAPGMDCEQAFCRIDIANPGTIKIIKKVNSSIDRCISLAYNPDDGKIYGITRFGTFVTVSPDGTQTVIKDLKLLNGSTPSGLSAGLIYDSTKHLFIWNALEKGSSRDSYTASYLYTFDSSAREMARVCTFSGNERFSFFAVAEKAVTGTPGKATIVSNTFTGTPSLSGTVKITLPTEFADGTLIPEGTSLELAAKADDTEATAITANAGQTVDVPFGPLTQGLHTFTFNVRSGNETGPASTLTLYTGNDTPNAPASVRFNAMGINWTASTGSVHGGYVDESKISYTVAVDGTTIAEGISGTSYKYVLPEGPVKAHTATVAAVFEGMKSAATESNAFVSGKALSLPVNMIPTKEESLLITLFDANHDGNGWRFSEPYMGDPYFVFQSNGKAGDDWIFLPAIEFASDNMIYGFSFDARRGDTNIPEKVEVFLATAPEPNSIIKEIIAETGPATYAFETISEEFTVPQAGNYYIGIHACGSPDAYFLFVNHFKVNMIRSLGAAPAAVSGLVAKPYADGELFADVSFVLPTATITGEAIPEGTILKASVNTSAASVETEGTPGQSCNVKIGIANGSNTISVQVFDGNLVGESASTDIFGGLDSPLVVSNLTSTISEDNLSAYLKWEAPSEGSHGGYVNPVGIKYWLITYTTIEGTEYPAKEREIGTDVFEYTYSVPDGTPLKTVRLGILAENEIDEAEYFASLSLMMGKPYELPMDERFAGRDLRYAPITVGGNTDDYDAFWEIDDPTKFGKEYANMSGKALMATPDRATSKGRVALPKFAIDKNSAELTFSFYACADMPAARILVQTSGLADPVEAGILDPAGKNGWTEQKITLPDGFNALGWVGVFIDVEFSSLNQKLLVDRYKFDEHTSAGIVDIASTANFECGKGKLVYRNLTAPLEVYNVSGVLVAQTADYTGSINLAAGIYLLRSGSDVVKICIH